MYNYELVQKQITSKIKFIINNKTYLYKQKKCWKDCLPPSVINLYLGLNQHYGFQLWGYQSKLGKLSVTNSLSLSLCHTFSVSVSVSVSVSLSVSLLCISLSIYLSHSISLSIHLNQSLYLSQSISLSLYISIYLFIYTVGASFSLTL